MEYYKVHTIKENNKQDFSNFLQKVKRAFLKTVGDCDMLTMQKNGPEEEETLYEELKRTGKYEFNCRGGAIDIEYGRCIYLAFW